MLASLQLYKYDPAQAKRELAESAYPHGFKTTLFEYGAYANVGQVVAAELTKIGIDAQVKLVSENDWFATETGLAGNRPTTVSPLGAETPDISGYDWLLGSQNLVAGQLNMADWAPPAVDKLLQEGNATANTALRFAAYSGILRQLETDVPYLPLYQGDLNIALGKGFSYPDLNANAFVNDDYALGLRPAV